MIALMWEELTDDGGIHDKENMYNWAELGYWSSSTYANDLAYAWGVNLSEGNTYANHRGYGNHVRAVRGGA